MRWENVTQFWVRRTVWCMKTSVYQVTFKRTCKGSYCWWLVGRRRDQHLEQRVLLLTWWRRRHTTVGWSRLEVVHGIAPPSVPWQAGGVVFPHILLQLLEDVVPILYPLHMYLVLLPAGKHILVRLTHVNTMKWCGVTACEVSLVNEVTPGYI